MIMFFSYYDGHTSQDESQKDGNTGNAEVIPTFNQDDNFFAHSVLKANVQLKRAHMELMKAEVKQKLKKDDTRPLFNLEIRLTLLNNESIITTSTSVPYANISDEKDYEYEEDVNVSLQFTLREFTKADRDLSIREVLDNKAKISEKPAAQKDVF